MLLRKKSESWLMRALGVLLRPVSPRFMRDFWTTIGSTVYVPSQYDWDVDWGNGAWRARHADIIDHEAVHIAQRARWGTVLYVLMYLGPSPFLLLAGLSGFAWHPLFWLWALALVLAPLTAGLAWGRFRIEREAYLIQIAQNPTAIDQVAGMLWSEYLYAWPPSWSRAWFEQKRKPS